MLKRLFMLCLTIMAFVFVGCEEYVNPKKVEFDVQIERNGTYNYRYQFLCYGSLSGFTGDAVIVIEDPNGAIIEDGYNVDVTGAKTPFSFTFCDGSTYGYSSGLPSYYNVKVCVNNRTVMKTSVVPRK